MTSHRSLKSSIYDREEKKMQYQSQIRGLNAYDRHNKFMRDYVQFYGKTSHTHDKLPIKTDQDTIREGYRFIISEDDDMESTWEKRLVKRYYDKLFKEYCIADMSLYKQGKIGLRWRTEKEVVSGKGQFICGNKKCNEKDGLGSYEVNFSYLEAGYNKQALVKLVACKGCAEKLAYRSKKEREHLKDNDRDTSKRKRENDKKDNDIDDEYDKNSNTTKKGRRTSASVTKERDADEDFEEFLEGMFP
ncbi:Folate-sensitive fragile site protein Fra10Ac1 [Musa troglodytarum]|uniref:Folate-sensitive fragile site protein Fra10Ac1 n=1 Tax=Musa troglodytarum TaxID=320322 RepID=A0A9E7ESN1_9LILI|nr:Folate-sensitive fragile site protein Fra10Ac1 [Musa troglodytarum]URD82466.1 Folate-sensitive fragile site protein Fra10Ac1 [Musa troglodytarum]